MKENEIIPIRTCKDCANCLITPHKNLYECWFEDYFYKVEPDQEACECFRSRKKEEAEHLKFLKEYAPELLDENGQQWKDPYVLLAKMNEASNRIEKGKKIVEIPSRPKEMTEETYIEYRRMAKLVADLWDICIEKNPIKIKNFSINRLDPDDWKQAVLKDVLYMIRKGKEWDDIIMKAIMLGESRDCDKTDLATYSIIRRFLYCQRQMSSYEEFIEEIAGRVPDRKKNEFLSEMRKKG